MAKIAYTPVGMSLKDRLAYRSTPGPNNCIDYVGHLSSRGYGQIRVGGSRGRTRQAHQISYEVYIGIIPKGMQVLHDCDRPSCINPAHLKIGTILDNMNDKATRGRAKKSLTIDKVRCIRADTRLLRIIAKKYGVTETMISRIRHRKAWRHVK